MALTFLPFLFPGVPHVRCAFQCRGLTPPPAVSAPDADYAGGNLSLDVNDDPESVRARRRALAAMLGVDDWVELRQVHGDALLFEPDPADPEQPSTLEADATVALLQSFSIPCFAQPDMGAEKAYTGFCLTGGSIFVEKARLE